MSIKSIVLAAGVMLSSAGALASSVQHGFYCQRDFEGQVIQIDLLVSYQPGESGRPGLVWLGQITNGAVPYADKALQTGVDPSVHESVMRINALFFMNGSGRWERYDGGLYSPYGVFRTEIAQEVTARFQVWPGGFAEIGFGGSGAANAPGSAYYFGHGLYTEEIEENISSMRAAFERTRTKRESVGMRMPNEGEWEHKKHALIQKDMVDNFKIIKVAQLPITDYDRDVVCGGNGGGFSQ
jgi:hypothetical protein